MTLVEIEAKRLVIEGVKKGAIDAANLELMPLRLQMGSLEASANRIALNVTEVISRCDGQLAILRELADELGAIAFGHDPVEPPPLAAAQS